jgi:hypothetical protein
VSCQLGYMIFLEKYLLEIGVFVCSGLRMLYADGRLNVTQWPYRTVMSSDVISWIPLKVKYRKSAM